MKPEPSGRPFRQNRPADKELLELEKDIRRLEKKKLEKELGEGGTTSAVDDWVSSIPDVVSAEDEDGDTDES